MGECVGVRMGGVHVCMGVGVGVQVGDNSHKGFYSHSNNSKHHIPIPIIPNTTFPFQ